MEIYGMTGEHLGTIGVPEQTKEEEKEEDLPQWKRDFLTKPSVSVRKGIAWGFKPPSEDSDVLVLTAPSSKFVDIRFPILDKDSNGSITDHPAFWAFSGIARTTFPSSSEGFGWPLAAHCAWEHEIDSRGPGITDEGDMFLLKNGDTMEIGLVENPTSGNLEMYKEYWTEPQMKDGENRKLCVLAETVSDDSWKLRGRIIRVGRYCQGIMEIGDAEESGLLVERWTREEEEGRWRADGRNGDRGSTAGHAGKAYSSLPCAWVWSEERNVGDETTTHGGSGVRWRILEVFK